MCFRVKEGAMSSTFFCGGSAGVSRQSVGISPQGLFIRPCLTNKPKHKPTIALLGGCCIFLLDCVTQNLLSSFLTVALLHPITVWPAEGNSSELLISAWETLRISGSIRDACTKRPRSRWLPVCLCSYSQRGFVRNSPGCTAVSPHM